MNITGNTIADNIWDQYAPAAILFVGDPDTAKLKASVYNNILYGDGRNSTGSTSRLRART